MASGFTRAAYPNRPAKPDKPAEKYRPPQPDKKRGAKGAAAYPVPQVSDNYERPKLPSYTPNYNTKGQSSNIGQTLADHQRQSKGVDLSGLSSDGLRGTIDFQKGVQGQQASAIARSLAQDDSEKSVQDMASFGQLQNQGIAAQGKLYADMNQRAVDQVSLAAKIAEANMMNHMSALQTWAARRRRQYGPTTILGSNTMRDKMFDVFFRNKLF